MFQITLSMAQCMLYKFPYRSCLESLQKLSLPPQALDHIKKLAGDLRLLCAKEVFKESIEGTLSTLTCIFFLV